MSVDGLLPNVRRIAVLRANALGDMVFALPALAALRSAYPAAEIVLLGRAWHAAFFAGRPGPVDRVLVVPGDDAPESGLHGIHSDAPWRAASEAERAAFAGRARREAFDLAVQIHGGGRNSNPFLASLGARWSVGLRSDDAPALDRWVRFIYYQHEVLRCLEVVALVGAAPVDLEPRLTLRAGDSAEAAAALAGVEPPYAVLHPGANDPRRRWPPDRFARVGDALEAAGLSLVVTGSRDELPLAEKLIGALHVPARNLAGRTSLGGLAGVLGTARLVISNDSGPLHLAAALGRPTVGVYWCGNLINGGPLTRQRHRPLIAWQVSCPRCGVPCTEARCPHDDSFVIEISVESVLAAAQDLLELPGETITDRPLVARGLHIGHEDDAQQGRLLHAEPHQGEERDRRTPKGGPILMTNALTRRMYAEPLTLRQAMDRLFEDSFVGMGDPGSLNWPSIDVRQTDDEVILTASLPGVKPNDVQVTITGQTINLRGSIRQEQDVSEDEYLYQERRFGAFNRSIQLPIRVQGEQARASFEDGILTISVPKSEEVKPRQIQIEIGSREPKTVSMQSGASRDG